MHPYLHIKMCENSLALELGSGLTGCKLNNFYKYTGVVNLDLRHLYDVIHYQMAAALQRKKETLNEIQSLQRNNHLLGMYGGWQDTLLHLLSSQLSLCHSKALLVKYAVATF